MIRRASIYGFIALSLFPFLWNSPFFSASYEILCFLLLFSALFCFALLCFSFLCFFFLCFFFLFSLWENSKKAEKRGEKIGKYEKRKREKRSKNQSKAKQIRRKRKETITTGLINVSNFLCPRVLWRWVLLGRDNQELLIFLILKKGFYRKKGFCGVDLN